MQQADEGFLFSDYQPPAAGPPSPALEKGPESLREHPQRPLDSTAFPPHDPAVRECYGAAYWQPGETSKGVWVKFWEERSGRKSNAWVMSDSSLTLVLLLCLISLELLQACVRVGPSSPFLRQKSGRALLKAAEQQKNIYRQEGNLVSPHPLAE